MSRLRCQHHDGALTYLVESEDREEISHLVDVAGYSGNGQCSCEHFAFKIQPALDRNERPRTPTGAEMDTRCKHIHAAREMFADFMIQQLTTKMAQIQEERANVKK